MKWELHTQDEKLVSQISAAMKIPPVIARLLINREIRSVEEADLFLHGDLRHLHSPDLLSGINEAVERIRKAVSGNERIVIFGDYDVDGITAIALLYHFFLKIGKRVDYMIPDRQFMGYGLNQDIIRKMKQDGYTLIITVDCGISNIDEVDFANSLGIDVIITDHHEPSAILPRAVSVINPKKAGEAYPYKYLAGVGVAFKLFQKLLKDYDFSDHFIYSNLDLVALGTIADIVPLTGENRIIARYGLRRMNSSDNLGINSLVRSTGLSPAGIDSSDVAFVMAPRINACGRIDDPKLAVRLLTTDNKEESAYLSRKLYEINRKRQKIEMDIMKEAEEQIVNGSLHNDSGLILYSGNWHAGVIGIVTSKLKEKFYRPVILISFDEDVGRASARSIEGFPLYTRLTGCAELLEKFGGHEMAAGFTIKKENIAQFKTKFQGMISDTLSLDSMIPVLSVDSELQFSEITEEIVNKIEMLAPFGMKNPQPVFSSTRVSVSDYALVGNTQRHLRMKMKQDGCRINAIGFNMSHYLSEISAHRGFTDTAYNVSLNTYQNETRVQLKVKDILFRQE